MPQESQVAVILSYGLNQPPEPPPPANSPLILTLLLPTADQQHGSVVAAGHGSGEQQPMLRCRVFSGQEAMVGILLVAPEKTGGRDGTGRAATSTATRDGSGGLIASRSRVSEGAGSWQCLIAHRKLQQAGVGYCGDPASDPYLRLLLSR